MDDRQDKIILLPSYDEVIACQFSSWYPIFSNLKNCKRSNVTIKSIIIDLQDEDVEEKFRLYLNTDKLIIPNGTHTSSALLERASNNEDPEWSSDDDDDNDENDAQKSVESSEDDEETIFEFPELTKVIDKAILDLGGSVIPKLNWSTPKDATWVNAGTLECRFAGDVYMLIKASDFCSYDINHSIIDINDINNKNNNNQNSIIMTPPKLQLILRKYCNLYPSQEFRCFVYNKKLIAISQRNHTQHYPHLVDHNCQNNIRNLIIHFFNTIMYHNAILNQYIFDIYIDKKQRIWLIDINVWGTRTDSLLYTWSELIQLCNNDNENDIIIRVVETDKQVRVDPLSTYKAPIDTVQILSGGGTNSTEFLKFMKMCKKPTDDVSSSSDDDDNEDI